MKNLIIIAVAILLGFTSCQKEQLELNQETSPIYTGTIKDQLANQKPLNNLGIKSDLETNGIPSNGQLFTSQISHPKDLLKIAKGRDIDLDIELPILCGEAKLDHNKLIFDAIDSKTNNYNGNDYYNQGQGCLNTSAGFNGRDVKYSLWVEHGGAYTIKLSQLSKDLDVFLYSLDNQGNIDQCLGYGLKYGVQNELIHANLDMGVYAVIVDAYVATDESDFKLEIECGILSNIICEMFEDHNTGAITPNASNWVKYSNNSGDANVTSSPTTTGGQTLRCDASTDVVYQFGKEYTDFTVYVSWEMYVPNGKSAAFAFEKLTQPGLEHSLRVFMNANNSISIVAKGQTFNSTYTYGQDQWVSVEVEYSLSGGRSKLVIDGNHVANFNAELKYSSPGTGQNKFAGINFWTQDAGSEFYLDSICHSTSNPWLTFLTSDSGTLEL